MVVGTAPGLTSGAPLSRRPEGSGRPWCLLTCRTGRLARLPATSRVRSRPGVLQCSASSWLCAAMMMPTFPAGRRPPSLSPLLPPPGFPLLYLAIIIPRPPTAAHATCLFYLEVLHVGNVMEAQDVRTAAAQPRTVLAPRSAPADDDAVVLMLVSPLPAAACCRSGSAGRRSTSITSGRGTTSSEP